MRQALESISRLLLSVSLALLLIGPASAELYKWTDKDGKVHFGDCPPADCEAEVVEVQPAPSESAVEEAREIADRLKEYHDARAEEEEAEPEVPAGEQEFQRQWISECFSSPEHMLGPERGDPATPISTWLLAPDQHARLASIFERLKGVASWKGTIDEVDCRGTEQEPRIEEESHRVAVRITHDLEGLVSIESEDPRFVLWLHLQENWLRFGDMETRLHDAPQWDIELLSVGTDSFEFLRKFRRQLRSLPRRMSTHHIELRSFSIANDTLIIREWFYTQGLLATMRTWSLSR